jgi:hypothetical protein
MDLSELSDGMLAARREGRTWVEIANSLSISISTLRRLRLKIGFVDPIGRVEVGEVVNANDVQTLSDERIVEVLDEMLALDFTYVAIARRLGMFLHTFLEYCKYVYN